MIRSVANVDLEFYDLSGGHGWQSDWLCAGKERNRNVSVFANLAAHFNVARPRFRDRDAGTPLGQRDISSVVVAQNRNRVADFSFRRIPIPGGQPHEPILSTSNFFANFTLHAGGAIVDRRVDLVVSYL